MFRAAIAAATTVAASSVFVIMDANPSLYLYDRFVNRNRLSRAFEGKCVWITGASSGIGAQLAQRLASHGANLVLSARSEGKLRQVAEKCRETRHDAGNIWIVPLDVTAPQNELEEAVDAVLANCELDCVVLNAGRGHQSPVLSTSPKVSMEMMQVNALGPINLARTILQKADWVKQRKGHFVIVSSVGGTMGIPLSSSYAASKHALHGYFTSVASEMPFLKVNMICPGPISTPFHVHNQQETQMTGSVSSSKMKMPVERCVQLVLADMMHSSRRKRGHFVESWIAQQPTLAFCFLNQYMPSLATVLLSKIGPIRVAMWEQGLDLYDPKSLRKVKLSNDSNR